MSGVAFGALGGTLRGRGPSQSSERQRRRCDLDHSCLHNSGDCLSIEEDLEGASGLLLYLWLCVLPGKVCLPLLRPLELFYWTAKSKTGSCVLAGPRPFRRRHRHASDGTTRRADRAERAGVFETQFHEDPLGHSSGLRHPKPGFLLDKIGEDKFEEEQGHRHQSGEKARPTFKKQEGGESRRRRQRNRIARVRSSIMYHQQTS